MIYKIGLSHFHFYFTKKINADKYSSAFSKKKLSKFPLLENYIKKKQALFLIKKAFFVTEKVGKRIMVEILLKILLAGAQLSISNF